MLFSYLLCSMPPPPPPAPFMPEGRTASADDTHLHQPIDVTNIKTSADAYSVLLQRLEDWETAGRAARAAQHEQLHILSLQVKVLQAAQPVLAALQQRLPAAEPASDGRKGRAGVQQAQLATTAAALQRANEAHAALVAATAAAGAALESGARLQQQVAATAAAIAPAAGGLSGLDAAQLLCYFTAGVSAASITLHHKQALDTDLKGIYKDTSSMRPTPAAHAWSDSELKVSSSSRTRFSGQYSSSITAQQQVGHATGTTQWSQDPVMNCPYDIEWLARRENGNSYLDVKATVHATGNSKAQKTTAMAVSKMLLLVGDAAGVAAVSQGQLEHSSWGGWGAIFTPSPEAVRDGRIVGAATGITEAVAGGVDMLVPATAAD